MPAICIAVFCNILMENRLLSNIVSVNVKAEKQWKYLPEKFWIYRKYSYICNPLTNMVRWPSGQAQVCKTCHSGSIPLRTSQNPLTVFCEGISFQNGAILGLLFDGHNENVWNSPQRPLQTSALKDSRWPASSSAKIVEFLGNSYFHLIFSNCIR